MLFLAVCDQCPDEDEHVQNEVHALNLLRYFAPFHEDFSTIFDAPIQQPTSAFSLLSELMNSELMSHAA